MLGSPSLCPKPVNRPQIKLTLSTGGVVSADGQQALPPCSFLSWRVEGDWAQESCLGGWGGGVGSLKES